MVSAMAMPILPKESSMKKRMAIISSYFEGEAYGVLGPQMAATIIEDNAP